MISTVCKIFGTVLIMLGLSPTPAPSNYSKHPPCGPKKVVEYSYHHPCPSKNLLFYMQRNKNENTIVYEANRDANGKLNIEEPVHIYWLRWAYEGDSTELNWVEKNIAFGCQILDKDLTNNSFQLSHVSLEHINFNLSIDSTGQAIAIAKIADKKARLTSLYVQATEYTWRWPKPRYLILYGQDLKTGRAVQERYSLEEY